MHQEYVPAKRDHAVEHPSQLGRQEKISIQATGSLNSTRISCHKKDPKYAVGDVQLPSCQIAMVVLGSREPRGRTEASLEGISSL